MIKRHLGIFILLALVPLSLYGQSVRQIELILELLPEGEQDRQIIVEQLEDLVKSPIDLNSASAEQLILLPFLDDFSVRNILLLRSQKGGFRSIYEIKEALPELPEQYLELLEPFIRVGESPYANRKHARHDFFIGSSIPIKRQTSSSLEVRYEGRKDGVLTWHFAGQKDKGESWLPLRHGGFDYLTGNLFWNKERYSLVVGDYRLTTAHGLLLGMGNGYFSALQFGGNGSGRWVGQLKPHRSFRETGFLRGVAVHVHSESPLSVLLFSGFEPIDARLEENRIRTLYRTGFHRTETERRYRYTARCEMIGSNLAYRSQSLELALTTLLYRYRTKQGEALLPYRLYPQRTFLWQNSVSVNYKSGPFQSTAELVLDKKERSAAQGAIIYREEAFGTLALQGRYYGVNYISPYVAPDSHYSSARGERGLRLMWEGEVAYWATGRLFIDRFRRIGPSSSPPGHVISARINYSNDPWWITVSAQYVAVKKDTQRFTARIQGDRSFFSSWSLRAGIQVAKQKPEPLGYSFYSRLRYHKDNFMAEGGVQYYRLHGSVVRGQLGYMPYLYTPSMLRGSGVHYFATMRYKLTPALQLNARIHPSFLDASLILTLQ